MTPVWLLLMWFTIDGAVGGEINRVSRFNTEKECMEAAETLTQIENAELACVRGFGKRAKKP